MRGGGRGVSDGRRRRRGGAGAAGERGAAAHGAAFRITADVKSVAAARMPEGDEFFAASSAITRSSGWPGRGRRATGAASERGCAPIAAAAAAAVAAAAAAAAAAIASPDEPGGYARTGARAARVRHEGVARRRARALARRPPLPRAGAAPPAERAARAAAAFCRSADTDAATEVTATAAEVAWPRLRDGMFSIARSGLSEMPRPGEGRGRDQFVERGRPRASGRAGGREAAGAAAPHPPSAAASPGGGGSRASSSSSGS